MSDTVFLRAMEFYGCHGLSDEERADPQAIEIDMDVGLDLRAAGSADDLTMSVDYGVLFEVCRAQVEEHTYRLLEALAEAIVADTFARFALIEQVVLTVRKPGVPIDGVLDHAGVRLERMRPA